MFHSLSDTDVRSNTSSDIKKSHDFSKKYLLEYAYRKERWVIEIDASSFQDAQHRLAVLSSGKVLGELKAKISISKPKSWFGRLSNFLLS